MKTLLTLMAVLLATVGAYAQGWEPTAGPEGANVISIAVNDSTILAAVEPGVIYRRDQTGWSRGATLKALELQAIDGVFMARTYEGIYRSTDLGDTWEQIGPQGDEFRFATDGTALYAAVDSMIWRLSEGGGAWTELASASLYFYTFFVHDSVMLLGRAGDATGMYRSGDKGTTWAKIETGLPPQGVPHAFYRLGTTLYVAMGEYGVFRSTDWGRSWSAMNEGLPADPGGLVAISSLADIRGELWGAGRNGAFSYRDGRWGLRAAGHFRTMEPAGELIYAGSINGTTALSTPPEGGPWMNGGITAHRIDAIGRFGEMILASTGGAIYSTTDRGTTWLQTWMHPKAVQASRFVTGDDAIYALGHHTFSTGIFRSDDGFLWESVGDGLPGQPYWLSALAGRGDTLFTGYYRTSWDGELRWVLGGIYRSVDRGESWQGVNFGLPRRDGTDVPLIDIHMTGSSVLAQTLDGLYRSTDGGETWARVTAEPTMNLSPRMFRQDGGKIFMAGPNKVIVSSDDGLTWRDTGDGIPGEVSITHLSIIHGIPYVSGSIGENFGRVYKLSGNRWINISDRFPEGIQFNEFIEAGDKVLASTAWNSVWIGTLDPASGVPGEVAMPGSIDLAAVPNPFNLGTAIDFRLEERGHVRLALLSQLGEELATLHEGMMEPGDHRVNLDGAALPSGVYHLRIEKGDGAGTMMVVKVK